MTTLCSIKLGEPCEIITKDLQLIRWVGLTTKLI